MSMSYYWPHRNAEYNMRLIVTRVAWSVCVFVGHKREPVERSTCHSGCGLAEDLGTAF